MSRARVAVVATTAETIVEDIHRALGLVGRAARHRDRPVLLAGASPPPHLPGAAAKPWQLEAWLAWRSAHGLESVDEIHRVSPGRATASGELNWAAAQGVSVVDCEPGAGALAGGPAPILGATWGSAPRRGPWTASRAVGLSSLVGSRDWALRGATSLFCDAQRARRPWPPRASWPDAVAEAMRLHRECFEGQVCVLDATVCGSDSRRRRPIVLDRVLAGTDPVAVDAVGALLLGWQPRSVPWLARLEEEGLGTCDLAQIECVGGGIDLSSQVARARTWRPSARRGWGRTVAGPLAEQVGGWCTRAYHALLWNPWVGRPIHRLYRECPWGRLEADARGARGAHG